MTDDVREWLRTLSKEELERLIEEGRKAALMGILASEELRRREE